MPNVLLNMSSDVREAAGREEFEHELIMTELEKLNIEFMSGDWEAIRVM